ncbi:cytosolic protein [Vibrio sp. 506]|uniref:cytosolic protein n=1 Tax=Vibrio sp. 506 TaxID=3074607 RepID=UPI0029643CD3|nr:cytosolic protein [Vibrio sp. 506]MDW2054199.1 cytosolic protein [Vibrio sp. 506]
MKLLYWLDEWQALTQQEQEMALPISGYDLLDDVFVKYELVDLNKPLLFTFSPSGTDVQVQDLTPDFSPWGYELGIQQQVNIIAFQHLGQSNWFRSRNLIFFLEQLSELLHPFKCRLGYGQSRGGFAIGAFANLLKLEHLLLFYPVSTKNKALVPWDDRPSTELAQQFAWESGYHDRDLGNAKGYIIYDPSNRIDRLHAERYPELTHLKVVGMGHGTQSTQLDKLELFNLVAQEFVRHQTLDIDQFNKQIHALF